MNHTVDGWEQDCDPFDEHDFDGCEHGVGFGEDDPIGCEVPGRCLMPGIHLESECHTAEMMAELPPLDVTEQETSHALADAMENGGWSGKDAAFMWATTARRYQLCRERQLYAALLELEAARTQLPITIREAEIAAYENAAVMLEQDGCVHSPVLVRSLKSGGKP